MDYKKTKIRLELYTAKHEFRDLLASLSIDGFDRASNNAPWTNSQLLFHMTFGYMVLLKLIPLVKTLSQTPKFVMKSFAWVLNTSTPLFNWINAFGAKGGGKVYNNKRIGTKFDEIINRLILSLDKLSERDLQKGIYYPRKWDPNFKEFMTINELFHYTYVHFKTHKIQITIK